ncbi:MAG: hypothetical protein ACK45I_02710, partial [Bacteroidota bacterium]
QYYYRLFTYLYLTGKTVQAKEYLETALLLNFNDHFLIYEWAPSILQADEITQLIDAFRNSYQ